VSNRLGTHPALSTAGTTHSSIVWCAVRAETSAAYSTHASTPKAGAARLAQGRALPTEHKAQRYKLVVQFAYRAGGNM
jgi:hypothetical protein